MNDASDITQETERLEKEKAALKMNLQSKNKIIYDIYKAIELQMREEVEQLRETLNNIKKGT